MKLKFTIFGYEICALEWERPWSIHIEPNEWELEEEEDDEDLKSFGWGASPLVERDEKLVWPSEEDDDTFGFKKGPRM
jgi:hypothetical protein